MHLEIRRWSFPGKVKVAVERVGLEHRDSLPPAITRGSLSSSGEHGNIKIHRDHKRLGSRLKNVHLSEESLSKGILTRRVKKVEAPSLCGEKG